MQLHAVHVTADSDNDMVTIGNSDSILIADLKFFFKMCTYRYTVYGAHSVAAVNQRIFANIEYLQILFNSNKQIIVNYFVIQCHIDTLR